MDRRIVFCSAVAALLLASCLGGGSEMFESPAAIPGDCAVEGNLIRNCGFDCDSFGWVCNAVAPDGVYSYAAHVQVVAGVADYCELGVHAYPARDCSGLPYTDSLVYQMFQPGTSWDQSPALAPEASGSPVPVVEARPSSSDSTTFFLGSTLPQ